MDKVTKAAMRAGIINKPKEAETTTINGARIVVQEVGRASGLSGRKMRRALQAQERRRRKRRSNR